MNARTMVLWITMAVALGSGCGKKKDDGAGSGTAAAPGAGGGAAVQAAAPALAFLPVEKIGVRLELPGDAKPEETVPDSYMISRADGSCTVMLSKVDPEMAMSYDFTLKEAQGSSMGDKFKAFSKNEKAENGGWAMEWTYTSGMDNGDMWGVSYRAVLPNGMFDCSRNTRSAEDAACIAHACASLKQL